MEPGEWDAQSGGGSALLKCHLGRCALGLCGFEQRRLLEAEHAGHLDGREDLAPDVVVGGGSLNACRAKAILFSVELSSSCRASMFWLAFRSGYASDRAKSRPRMPPNWTSAWLSPLMATGSPGLAATFCSAAIALLRALMTASSVCLSWPM